MLSDEISAVDVASASAFVDGNVVPLRVVEADGFRIDVERFRIEVIVNAVRDHDKHVALGARGDVKGEVAEIRNEL